MTAASTNQPVRSMGARLRAIPPLVSRLVFLAATIGLWEIASQTGLINAFTAPPPSAIWGGFIKIINDGELGRAFVSTFVEALAASTIGSICGIAIGWWLHSSKKIGVAYTSWVAAAASAPLVLLYPLFLVIFGRNGSTIVAMGALGCMPAIILKAKDGLDGVRPVLLNVGRAFSLTPRQQFTMIQFPAALPVIFTGIRIGLLFAIINVVGVEFLIAFGGLGFLISDLGDRFDYPAMYAAIFFVVLVSITFFYLTEKLEIWLLSSK